MDSISVCRMYHAQSSFPHSPTNSWNPGSHSSRSEERIID
jgi:hypothetical protein